MKILFLLMSAWILNSCGTAEISESDALFDVDESGEEKVAILAVEDWEQMPECNQELRAQKVYVIGLRAVFACDQEWLELYDADITLYEKTTSL